MSEQSMSEIFEQTTRSGENYQAELFDIYKSSIGLINDLRKRSKQYMNLLSDIEGGLSTGGETENIESTLALLTKDIQSFNEIIGDKCDAFSKASEDMLLQYAEACNNYEAKEGQLSKLLEIRKQLLFILALIRKYKYKINSLQLMNNILFSLSADLKEAKDAYKSNLIYISTAMTYVIEQMEHRVLEIENLN